MFYATETAVEHSENYELLHKIYILLLFLISRNTTQDKLLIQCSFCFVKD